MDSELRTNKSDSASENISKTLIRASLFTVLSLIIGLAYYLYLTHFSFPQDWTRIIPFIWLAGATVGLRLGVKTLGVQRLRPMGFVIVALCIINALFATIFLLAALIGD